MTKLIKLVLLLFLALMIVSAIASMGKKTPTSIPEAGTSNTLTSEETSTQTPPPTLTPTPAPVVEKAEAKVIPGMAPVDIYGNLTSRGFTKTGPEKSGDIIFWNCSQNDADTMYTVEIYSHSASTVESFRAIAVAMPLGSMKPDPVAREFLGFLSTLPYDGAEPEKAKKWVEENVGKTAETTIGAVRFKLENTSDRARQLTVSAE